MITKAIQRIFAAIRLALTKGTVFAPASTANSSHDGSRYRARKATLHW